MPRRYLDISEVTDALKRGRQIECFLGGFVASNVKAIRWASIVERKGIVELCFWEARDIEDPEFDIWEIGPLNSEREFEEPEEEHKFQSLLECLEFLESRFAGASIRLVNQGVAQDEYRDYLRTNEEQ